MNYGGQLLLMMPPKPWQTLTKDEALMLAAYLVLLADDSDTAERFVAALDALKNA